jgi:hypothetical protein
MSLSFAVYKLRSKAGEELASCTKALFNFYGVIAAGLLVVFVLEMQFGMFEGLSTAQALLKATGMDLTPDSFVSML